MSVRRLIRSYTFDVTSVLQGDIDTVVRGLLDLKELGVSSIGMECTYSGTEFYTERLETDEELQARLDLEKADEERELARKERQKEIEYKKYLTLKKKYEGEEDETL